jgi:hypothetical protein
MLDRAALASLLVAAAAATAHADEPATATAGTLVVVTPAAPVIVTSGAPAVAAPGAEEDPPAAPVAAAATPAAPQNEAWSNVSHINGTPVPVGERNRYLYKFKKTNIAVNPFGPFVGYYDASATFAVTQNLALSVSGAGYSMDHGYTSGYQVAATLPIYFRRTYSGPYLEPGLMTRHSSHHLFDAGDEVDQWSGVEMLFGWQWMFDSGLNVQAAFGFARHLASSDSYESDDADANGYFRVGYAF